MKSRSATTSSAFAPFRGLPQRMVLPCLVTLSLAIMIVGHFSPPTAQRLRIAVADTLAPVLKGVRQPVIAISEGLAAIRNLGTLYQDNTQLRADNATLLQWQEAALRLQAENTALRSLTHYAPPGSTWFVTGQVIGTEGGAFSRSVLIDRGLQDGVDQGQAALTGTGLVGRIVEVGDRTARALLITDLNSRIPVLVESSHDRAILAGDNTDQPQLNYLPAHAQVQIGDRIVTSGDGGVFPPGLPVGQVASTDDGVIRIDPYANLSRIDYLRLADFGLAGVLPRSAVPAPRPAATHHRSHGGHGKSGAAQVQR